MELSARPVMFRCSGFIYRDSSFSWELISDNCWRGRELCRGLSDLSLSLLRGAERCRSTVKSWSQAPWCYLRSHVKNQPLLSFFNQEVTTDPLPANSFIDMTTVTSALALGEAVWTKSWRGSDDEVDWISPQYWPTGVWLLYSLATVL